MLASSILRSQKRLLLTQSRSFSSGSMFGDFENHGLFPRYKPLAKLPKEFEQVDQLCREMTWFDTKGEPTGYLARNEFRKTIREKLPDLTELVAKVPDGRTQAALFRDYGFLAAGYMHEGTHLHWVQTGNYGVGESFLPK